MWFIGSSLSLYAIWTIREGLSEIDITDISPNICWVLLTLMWLAVVMENCAAGLVCREMRSLCHVSGAVSHPPFDFVC